MDDSCTVSGIQCLSDLHHQTRCCAGRDCLLGNHRRQRNTVDELHDDALHVAVRQQIMNRHNARMVQRRGHLRLTKKGRTRGRAKRLRTNNLDGDVTAQPRVLGPENEAHTSPSQSCINLIGPDELLQNWRLERHAAGLG